MPLEGMGGKKNRSTWGTGFELLNQIKNENKTFMGDVGNEGGRSISSERNENKKKKR